MDTSDYLLYCNAIEEVNKIDSPQAVLRILVLMGLSATEDDAHTIYRKIPHPKTYTQTLETIRHAMQRDNPPNPREEIMLDTVFTYESLGGVVAPKDGDENSKGTISVQKLREVMVSLSISNQAVEDLMAEVDDDNSGSLSFTEFNHMVESMYSGSGTHPSRATIVDLSERIAPLKHTGSSSHFSRRASHRRLSTGGATTTQSRRSSFGTIVSLATQQQGGRRPSTTSESHQPISPTLVSQQRDMFGTSGGGGSGSNGRIQNREYHGVVLSSGTPSGCAHLPFPEVKKKLIRFQQVKTPLPLPPFYYNATSPVEVTRNKKKKKPTTKGVSPFDTSASVSNMGLLTKKSRFTLKGGNLFVQDPNVEVSPIPYPTRVTTPIPSMYKQPEGLFHSLKNVSETIQRPVSRELQPLRPPSRASQATVAPHEDAFPPTVTHMLDKFQLWGDMRLHLERKRKVNLSPYAT
eukprot:PhF_6_TR25677/c0_g1_i1/m.36180